MNAQPETDEQNRRVARLIDAIEHEMRQLALWGEVPPPVAAMASRTPFCYDTLKLWQWLQWILVPRMRHILDEGSTLPVASDIAPLAEVEFRRLSQDTQRLLELIRAFDQTISTNLQSSREII
jgi:uncharacterized protein YqcC (DUF446 family)